MTELPFSQAAHNNRGPILEELRRLLGDRRRVLEIGAGTGQHAVHFARELPQVTWLPTEHPEALALLRLRCAAEGPANLAEPRALDIARRPWSLQKPPTAPLKEPSKAPLAEPSQESPTGPSFAPEAIYAANTLHIVGPGLVETFFRACAEQAVPDSLLLVYGPFNYGGRYTSESNARFDEWLRDRDPVSAIRDFEWVDSLAAAGGYALLEDLAMPANNRLLCWRFEGRTP